MPDRFYGEPPEPPVWDWCDYCGGKVHVGQSYYDHEGDIICDECAVRFAWVAFEQRSVRCVARGDV